MIKPETDADLARLTYLCTGMRIADNPFCEHHVSPFKAFADAYFCRSPISVWHASRGFGGKSLQLATLSMVEAIFQGASVSLLGGSGEQSARVHSYITGQDTNLPNTFWTCPTMPYDVKKLLMDDKPTKRETRLANGGRISVLMASQTSVRGPHPNKLRLDECLVGDTLVTMEGSLKKSLDSIAIGDKVVSYYNGVRSLFSVTDFAHKGVRKVYKVRTSRGFEITGTSNHGVYCSEGLTPIIRLSMGSKLVIDSWKHRDLDWVDSIEYVGLQDVYDITVDESHSFIANDILVHNCDEMDLKIFDASLGQPMSSRGIESQIVCSSTHHNPNGTMTEILDRAKKRGWPIYEWCYRENLTTQGGWLDPRDVEARRLSYTESLWKAEIELQEPTPEDRGINTDAVEAMFKRELGEYVGNPDEYIESEPPVEGGKYATGADWAQKRDWSVFWTWRIDVEPARMVAFRRTGRRPWSEMIEMYDNQCERFKGASGYDETGIGNVVKEFMKTKSRGFILTDKVKLILINSYIKAIEDGKVIAPMIQFTYGEHKFCSRNELIGSGHLPDSVCSAAIAWQMRGGGGWARGAA